MPRNRDQVRERLQQAALELFQERGYDAVTTAEIAARAGVTERTFFRHFPDKREALFDGEDAFRETLAAAVLAAPSGLKPLDVLLWTFRQVEHTIEANRPITQPRQAIIAQSPALQERVGAKTASVTAALAEALGRRGVEPALARLAAQVGMAAFSYAAAAWAAEPSSGLGAQLVRAFGELRGLSGERAA